jgi:hypothetical protein
MEMSHSEIWKISKGSDLNSHIRYFKVRNLTSYLMKQEIMPMPTRCRDLVIIVGGITETFCHNLEGLYKVFDDKIIMLAVPPELCVCHSHCSHEKMGTHEGR